MVHSTNNSALHSNINTNFHWAHWLVVLASLLLTLSAWYIAKSQVESKLELQFEREADQVLALIKERMGKYEDALWSGVAAIRAQNNEIDAEKWKQFADNLSIEKRYPGINGVGIIKYFPANKLEQHLAEERKLRSEYKVHPQHHKDEFWPIVYIEPSDINSKAIGLDIAHENNRHAGAKYSRDTGNARATAPIILVQDAEKTPGFLFYAPYYSKDNLESVEERQKHFVGLVYAPFIVKNLMSGTLKKEGRLTNIQVSDGQQVLYDEHNTSFPDYDKDALFDKDYVLQIYGRPWKVNVQSNKSFRDITKNDQPTLILIAGLMIDALLFTVFFLLVRSKKRAVELANKATRGLRDAKNFQELIKQANTDFLFVKDSKFRIVDANQAFINAYPKEKRNEVIGYTTLEQYDPDEVEQFLENDRIAFATGESEVIEKVIFPDGEVRKLLTKKIRFENEEGESFILGTSRDVTKRENLVEQLRASNQELDDFAYIASHDLREPLRGIQIHSHSIIKKTGDVIGEEAKHKLERIIYLTNFMDGLISDLLYFSRLGRTDEATQLVGLEEIILDVKQTILAARDEKITITIHPDLPKINCNKQRIKELFYNLIVNAVKYNEQDHKIIEIGLADTQSDLEADTLFVSDNGIGIDPKHHDSIFKIFKRLHKKDAYEGGTGSGLTFVRKIVEQHSGSITVQSQLGEGAIFYITLPKTKV